MPGRVLHVLSQRPSLTGSGVTLDAFVRYAAQAGWEQGVVVGVPLGEPYPQVGELPARNIFPLFFESERLPFPVPGMSDVMPYRSTRFGAMRPDQLNAYRRAWTLHLREAIDYFRPDIIHAHHIWLMSSLLKDNAPDIPVVNHCHATGLRQMELCPHLADEVVAGCRKHEAFLVLHEELKRQLCVRLNVPAERVRAIGGGYRHELFHMDGRDGNVGSELMYIGKYSAAKGLPWLLDAVEELAVEIPDLRLHVAGNGAGAEADALRVRMEGMPGRVTLYGQLAQPELAALMRRCRVCVLPSFYEGVPLVLIEALACGCRLVATNLSGVAEQIAPLLSADLLHLVEPPRLENVDRPIAEDLPAFKENLKAALRKALSMPELVAEMSATLSSFTWKAVFANVEVIWNAIKK